VDEAVTAVVIGATGLMHHRNLLGFRLALRNGELSAPAITATVSSIGLS
jgi:hypothetical protein